MQATAYKPKFIISFWVFCQYILVEVLADGDILLEVYSACNVLPAISAGSIVIKGSF